MNESTIYKKLYDFFKPEILKVINDSEKHKGHSGSPNSGNSHFSITIKSKKLNGLRLGLMDKELFIKFLRKIWLNIFMHFQ